MIERAVCRHSATRLKQLKNLADRIVVHIAPSKTRLGEEEDLVSHFHFRRIERQIIETSFVLKQLDEVGSVGKQVGHQQDAEIPKTSLFGEMAKKQMLRSLTVQLWPP